MALVKLSKGQQMAADEAWYQILRKTLSVPATASGSAILKVLGVPPMSFRSSKLNACFIARVYDATPGEYRSACSSHQWIKEMQALTENAGMRQGSNASKIRNLGPRVDTFLTINEGGSSHRGTKRGGEGAEIEDLSPLLRLRPSDRGLD